MRYTGLTPHQEKTGDSETDAEQPLPRSRLTEEDNASDGHDSCAARKDDRHGRQRTTTLKKEEERNGTGAYANASERGIPKTLAAELLVVAPGEVKEREIDQDRKRRSTLDDEAADAVADVIGRHTRKDLMRT